MGEKWTGYGAPHYTTLHGALNAAQQAHLIASNPSEQIIAPRFSYGAKQVLTDE